MKVRELIELLQKCDPDHIVVAPLLMTDWVERPRRLYTIRKIQPRVSNGFERDYPTGPVVVLDCKYTKEDAIVPRGPKTITIPDDLIDFRFSYVPSGDKLVKRFGWEFMEVPLEETLVCRLGWALHLNPDSAHKARLWLAQIWAEIVGEKETNPDLLLHFLQGEKETEGEDWLRLAKIVLENNPELIPWAEAALLPSPPVED